MDDAAGQPELRSAMKPKRRWYQFSVRGLMIGTAVVAATMAGGLNLSESARRQRGAVRMAERLGAHITYADAAKNGSWLVLKLRNWLPQYYFDDIVSIDLSGSQVTDGDLVHLQRLVKLRDLNLTNTGVTDPGLPHLRGLTSLIRLRLANTQVTDAGLTHLAGISSLKLLDLTSTKVTNAGIEHIRGLAFLDQLCLANTGVTPEAFVQLRELRALKLLWLDSVQATDSGITEHRSHLPRNCRILRWQIK